MAGGAGDLKSIQETNRRLVLQMLVKQAPVSRATIARMVQLSPSTITNAVAELIADGVVREVGAGDSSGGRKPILLDVNWGARHVLAVSAEADRISAAWVNLQLQSDLRLDLALERREDCLAVAQEAVARLLRERSPRTAVGIGVAAPGLLDRGKGAIVNAASYGWRDIPLAAALEDTFGLPAWIENDVNAAALGEGCAGAGRGLGDFAYVLVDNAVGAGLVVDGRLALGAMGNAGEFGHMTIDWNGEECACGGRGCLERSVCWPVVRRRLEEEGLDAAREEPVPYDRRALLHRLSSSRRENRALRTTAAMLGAGIASLINLTDPRAVILEGVFSRAPAFIDWVQAEVARRMRGLQRDVPPILPGELGDAATLAGAAVMAFERSGLSARAVDGVRV